MSYSLYQTCIQGIATGICIKKVNEIFARNVLEEVGDKKAFVFIQDYHLALLPKMIKEKNPQYYHRPVLAYPLA